MAILTVNGVGLHDPSTLSIAVMDIDASTTTRNAKGVMLRDRVRGGANCPRKLEAEWKGLRVSEVATILQAVAPEFFSLTYFDTYTGAMRTAQFYVGDRTSSVFFVNVDDSGNPQDMVVESLKFNFIEK